MLAVGDKCIYREDCYGIPELGVIGGFNDTDEDYVFFEPLFSSGMCRWVRKDRVTKVKSVNDSTICRSSEVYPNECASGSEHRIDKNDDLCGRMDMLSTFDETEEQSKPSEEQLEPSSFEWQVNDVCVCRWWKDNKWYFAKIVLLRCKTGYCGVKILHYDIPLYFFPLDRIHRVDASSWKWVEDKDNAFAAEELLRSGKMKSNGMTLPTALSELEAKSEGGVMKRKDRRRRGKWRTGGGPTGSYTLPTMSPLWRTLLLELYGSDQNAVEKLLTSLFKSGFRSGYANAQKRGE